MPEPVHRTDLPETMSCSNAMVPGSGEFVNLQLFGHGGLRPTNTEEQDEESTTGLEMGFLPLPSCEELGQSSGRTCVRSLVLGIPSARSKTLTPLLLAQARSARLLVLTDPSRRYFNGKNRRWQEDRAGQALQAR